MNFSNPYTVDTRPEFARALGIKGYNADPVNGDSSVLLTSGTTRYGMIALTAGSVVTNVHFWVTVTAGTVTTLKGGLYSRSGSTGTLLAASANTTTAFDDYGMRTFVLSSPYTVPTTDFYLGAALSVATTPGTLLTLGGGAGVAGKSSSILFGGSEAGQTDLDASSTIASSTLAIWVGWS